MNNPKTNNKKLDYEGKIDLHFVSMDELTQDDQKQLMEVKKLKDSDFVNL